MFLSVNGTAQSYGTAQNVPSRYITSPPAAARSSSGSPRFPMPVVLSSLERVGGVHWTGTRAVNLMTSRCPGSVRVGSVGAIRAGADRSIEMRAEFAIVALDAGDRVSDRTGDS